VKVHLHSWVNSKVCGIGCSTLGIAYTKTAGMKVNIILYRTKNHNIPYDSYGPTTHGSDKQAKKADTYAKSKFLQDKSRQARTNSGKPQAYKNCCNACVTKIGLYLRNKLCLCHDPKCDMCMRALSTTIYFLSIAYLVAEIFIYHSNMCKHCNGFVAHW